MIELLEAKVRRQFSKHPGKKLIPGITAAAIAVLLIVGYPFTDYGGLIDGFVPEAHAQAIIEKNDARPEDFYRTYRVWTEKAGKANTEAEKKKCLDYAIYSFNKGIEIDMAPTNTAEDVLSYYTKTEKVIKEIRPNSGDLEKMVNNSSRPSIVLVYEGALNKGEHSKRAAIVFKNLYEMAGGRSGEVNFFIYDISKAPDYKLVSEPDVSIGASWARTDTAWGSEIKKEFTKKSWVIKDTPDFLIFSPFDLAKGETPKSNDGKIKLVDVAFGAPDENKYILPRLKNFTYLWAYQHCLYKPRPNGDRRVFIYNNTYKLTEVPNVFVR
jgi:hypothetical protein